MPKGYYRAYVKLDQFDRKFPEPFDPLGGITQLNCNVLPLYHAGVAQSLIKGFHPRWRRRGWAGPQHSDPTQMVE